LILADEKCYILALGLCFDLEEYYNKINKNNSEYFYNALTWENHYVTYIFALQLSYNVGLILIFLTV